MLGWLKSSSLRPAILLGSPIILALLAIAINSIHLSKYSSYSDSSTNCASLLKHGRYIDDSSPNPRVWQPDGCTLRDYALEPSDLFNYCFNPGDEIIFTGDSTARQVFWGFTNTFERGHLHNHKRQKDITTTINNITISFYWNPKFNFQKLSNILKYSHTPTEPGTKRYLFVSAGLWFGLFSSEKDRAQMLPKYKTKLDVLFDSFENRVPGSFESVYFAPVFIPAYPYMRSLRRTQMSPEFCQKMINHTDNLFNYQRTGHGGGPGYKGGIRSFRPTNNESIDFYQTNISTYYVPVFNELYSEHHYSSRELGGMHFVEPGFLTEGNILMNHMCNEKVAKAYRDQNKIFPQGTCCVPRPREHGSLVFIGLILAVVLYIAFGFLRSWIAVITGTIVAAAYTALINRSPKVSFVTPSFRSGDTIILFQVWALITWASLGTITKSKSKSTTILPTTTTQQQQTDQHDNNDDDDDEENWSRLLRSELKGIATSLLIVIAVSGWDRATNHVMGEIWSRVLLSIWACADIVSFMDEYSRSQRKLIFIPLRFLRLALLPLVLEASSGTFGRVTDEWLSRLSASSHWSLPVRLSFWYFFVTLFCPISKVISDRVVSWVGIDENSFFSHTGKSYLIVIFAALIHIGFQFGADKWQPLRVLIFDYWVIAAAIVVGPSWHASVNNRRIFLGAIVAALVAINIAGMSFGSFFPQTYATIEPMVQAEFFSGVIDAGLDARARSYNAFWHFVVTISLLWSYSVVRTIIMDMRIVPSSSSIMPIIRSSPTFSRAWTFLGPLSYELLSLRPHVILAHGGSLLVHLIPTGIIMSSAVKRTMLGTEDHLYPKGIEFEYGTTFGAGKSYGYGFQYSVSWNVIVETLRRTFSLALVLSVALSIAWACSSGWEALMRSIEISTYDIDGQVEFELVENKNGFLEEDNSIEENSIEENSNDDSIKKDNTEDIDKEENAGNSHRKEEGEEEENISHHEDEDDDHDDTQHLLHNDRVGDENKNKNTRPIDLTPLN
ncbi:uncharacterized protein SAPINGB_P002528 [Magnusiomyces paraingens]|uniref:Cas1p 10 TM acyl transferase domain-containing protein n=1 Tax=Magnusiomyces paraingens TaxID=2606893 RepID=A0A5E8BED4_9ASCO|nr:uncharacterized protein SAPINGB_P002528 [Saprochaete ingens]VVT49955.1 unnamed protein product [Saprochaete ingens]